MSTKDHTVPQMYLRRFAEKRGRSGHIVRVVPVQDPSAAYIADVRKVGAVRGFYWAQLPDGQPDHSVEHFFQKIETAATGAISALLDDREYALSRQWPLNNALRERMSWFIAAQLVRTTRQRKRVLHVSNEQQLRPTAAVHTYVRNHRHLKFIATHIATMAWTINVRPWGLMFSDVCISTSDVPVVTLQGHDAEDQLDSVTVADILMPLDAHRLLFLPGPPHMRDVRKQVDHRAKLDGGLGLFVSEIIRDAADEVLIQHPAHQPPPHPGKDASPRLPRPWSETANSTSTPEYFVSYSTMHGDLNVDARWLREHPPRPSSTESDEAAPGKGDAEPPNN